MNVNVKYKWRFHANKNISNFNGVFASFLRNLADRIDGRTSVAIFFESDPKIKSACFVESFEKGLDLTCELLVDEVINTAIEQQVIENIGGLENTVKFKK